MVNFLKDSLLFFISFLAAFILNAAEPTKITIGGGRADVRSITLDADPEKQKRVELEILMDDDLAEIVTSQNIRILNIPIDITQEMSARDIFKLIKKELETALSLDYSSQEDESESEVYEEDLNKYYQWPTIKEWKFEIESIQDGRWEDLAFSLFGSLKRWLTQTVNWIFINVFKILFCLVLGVFLYKFAPDLQSRSLVYLRRNPIFSFALGWIFLLLAGAVAIALLVSLVGIPFFFILWMILFILFFLGYILVSQLLLFFLSRVLPFLWFKSTVLRLLAGLIFLTILEYYVPYFTYVTLFLVMAGFGAQVKEIFNSGPRASVRGA